MNYKATLMAVVFVATAVIFGSPTALAEGADGDKAPAEDQSKQKEAERVVTV